jgi:hypothetical protein
MAKLSEYLGQPLNLKIREIFGTVKAKVVAVGASDFTISFTSFGSAYVMVVPKHWVMSKNTEGKILPISKGTEVLANIETPEISTKRIVLEEVHSAGLLVSAGDNIRFISWNDIKEIRVPKEKTEKPAGKRSAVPGKAAAAPARPAARPAPAAPAKAGKAPLRRG